MPLSATQILATGFNNDNFTRYLTATIVSYTTASQGSLSAKQLISWSFDTCATAYSSINLGSANIYPTITVTNTATNTSYLSGVTAPASSIGTLYFTFTAPTYNDATSTYSLCSLALSCFVVSPTSFYISPTSAYVQQFDTFPVVDLNVNINYESTYNNSYFYRLTSTSNYPVSARFLSTSFTNLYLLTSTGAAAALSSKYFPTYFFNGSAVATINNLPTNFYRNVVSTVSSIGISISALSADNSRGPWYTPHIVQQTLSAKFIPYWLSAGFIGYTDTVLTGGKIYQVITNGNYLSAGTPPVSAGLTFLGEGHTANVTLCATYDPRITQYGWTISNIQSLQSSLSYSNIPLSSINNGSVTTSSNTVTANIPTYSSATLNLPISLQTSDNTYFTLSTDPVTYYDDLSGTAKFYPYYSSTLDTFGFEATATNNINHQSIVTTTYEQYLDVYNLYPGISSAITLPANNTPLYYESLFTNLTSTANLPCLDIAGGNNSKNKGLIWSWDALSSTPLQNYNNLTAPLSWSSLQLYFSAGSTTTTLSVASALAAGVSGSNFKQWKYQGSPTLSAAPISVYLTGGGITWSLNTNNWSYPYNNGIVYTNNATETFDFSLQSGNNIGINNTGGIVSQYQDTPITIQASRVITAQVLSSVFVPSSLVNDYIPRDITLSPSFSTLSFGQPHPLFFTPNRYVLTGSNIIFENVSTNTQFISAINVNFDTVNYLLTCNQSFTATSSYIGSKDLIITAYTTFPSLPTFTTTLTGIVQVISQYDDVVPAEYKASNTISLPWTTQPKVGSNDWVTDDNINSCISKFYDNLQYLDLLGYTYSSSYTEYFGYLSPYNSSLYGNSSQTCTVWSWEAVDCTLQQDKAGNGVTWNDAALSGAYANCSTWQQQFCNYTNQTTTVSAVINTQHTLLSAAFPKIVCNQGVWSVNIPGLNSTYSSPFTLGSLNGCNYRGIASRNNNLYTALPTQVNLLSSNYLATIYGINNLIDRVKPFSSIANICLDTAGKVFVLDTNLSQVVTFIVDQNNNWTTFNSWGGFGLGLSKSRFNLPNDIHVDQLDNVWVCDTGNYTIKQYSNTGTWLLTINDSNFKNNSPLSLAVDSQRNVHVLTANGIFVYSYTGNFVKSYNYSNYVTSKVPRRIATSYNREILYVAFDSQVIKFFRNGVFAGTIISNIPNIVNINGLYHDEYRNLLITSDNIILKYPDLMQLLSRKGPLPSYYWQLNDLLIHKDEYVQNWVYTKSFQRLWDNIEYFRNTLFYSSGNCLSYTAPTHDKSKMIIGQNEIVTSTVINRVLGYLWDNLTPLINYFDPNCNN